MSARDGLIGRLVIFGLSEQAASRVVDAYAHELAEKIRKAPFEEHLLQGHQRARAARIIDPEVTE